MLSGAQEGRSDRETAEKLFDYARSVDPAETDRLLQQVSWRLSASSIRCEIKRQTTRSWDAYNTKRALFV